VLVYITELKKIRTKKGETMAFLTVSDQSGDMEAVVFPTVLKRYSILLQQGNIVIVDGKIEERNGAKQLIISSAKEVVKNEEAEEGKNVLYLKIQKHQEQGEFLHVLKKLLNRHSGGTPVILYYEETRRSIRLGKEDYVQPTTVLLKEIQSLLGSDNVILK